MAKIDNDYGGLSPTQVATFSNVKPEYQGLWETTMGPNMGNPNYQLSAQDFNGMIGNMYATPAWAVAAKLYGSKFTKLYTQASIEQSPDQAGQWLQGQMMANGMGPSDPAFVAAMKKLGPGQRGPGGGGGGPSKAQQYAAAEAAIRNEAKTLGHTTFGEPAIKSLAQKAVNNNWSGDQLTDFLVTDATKNWDKLTGGTLKGSIDQIKAAASKQLINISETTARQWAARLASGEIDASGMQNMMQEQAVARYGWAADTLKKGVSMSDLLAPSRDRIAEVLELAPDKVDLMDARYSKMVTVTDAKGVKRVANDDEIIRAARTDAQWTNTKNARTIATSAGMALRNLIEGRAS